MSLPESGRMRIFLRRRSNQCAKSPGSLQVAPMAISSALSGLSIIEQPPKIHPF
jgi:hypothetical protein